MRRLSQKEKVPFKRSRWLLLKSPWNLSDDQKERLSTLVQWNMPIVRAYYLKEDRKLTVRCVTGLMQADKSWEASAALAASER
jgi:hypothetical protein